MRLRRPRPQQIERGVPGRVRPIESMRVGRTQKLDRGPRQGPSVFRTERGMQGRSSLARFDGRVGARLDEGLHPQPHPFLLLAFGLSRARLTPLRGQKELKGG